MSNKDNRCVEDHHIANLDRHADKLIQQLQANEWKLLSKPDIEIYELKELLQDQAELEKVLGWLSNIKMKARPPQIIGPGNAANGFKLVN